MVASPGIAITDLTFSIGSFSLGPVDLSIAQHDYCVLTGPNGSGKTLLLKLMCGLLTPAAGDVCLGGASQATTPPWERNIGYVPQDGVLFPNMTALGNIAFGLEVRGIAEQERGSKAREVADKVGVAHLLDRTPDGLSGGERQKVAVARALVFEPRVLLLDEPVSALDEDARDDVCRLLKSLHTSMHITTVHVSHNRGEMDLVADRVVHMRAGTIPDAEHTPQEGE